MKQPAMNRMRETGKNSQNHKLPWTLEKATGDMIHEAGDFRPEGDL
jgi:hypothetical protein